MRATERLCGFLHVVHDWAGQYHESQADREEDADRHRLDNTEMRLRSIDWGPQQVDSSTRHGDEDRQTGEDDQSDERQRRRRNTFLEAEESVDYCEFREKARERRQARQQ